MRKLNRENNRLCSTFSACSRYTRIRVYRVFASGFLSGMGKQEAKMAEDKVGTATNNFLCLQYFSRN